MRATQFRLATSVATLLAVGIVLFAGTASAGNYYRKGTFVAGGGFNNLTGKSDDYFNGGGTLILAGGRTLNEKTTIQVEYTHNWLGIDPEVIARAQSDSVQFDNAYASMWSLTLNGVYRIKPSGDIVPWVTGGIGYYKRNLVITQTALYYSPPIYDPWWGWVDGGWYEGEAVTGSRATSGFGYNVGAGLDFGIESGAALFIEARWHHADLDGVAMDVIPVSFGIRW